jgi:AcrR family transcriptional regulator
MVEARIPTQERGKMRVEALIEAAESVIAARGYDAATMTEIAERAGASIGSLYQYFPTKAAIADMLRSRLWDALYAELAGLSDAAKGATPAAFATRLIAMLSDFYRRRPALQNIAEARLLPSAATADVRQRLRREVAAAISVFAPRVTKDGAEAAAVVVYEFMKGARAIDVEPRLRHRAAAAAELQAALEGYLATLARKVPGADPKA